jgi:hypothetical protein
MFGSVVGWMLAALLSCLVLLVGLCAGCEGLPWPFSLCDSAAVEHVSASLHCCVLCRGLLHVICWYVGVLPLKVGSCRRDRPQDVETRVRASALVYGRKITMYMHTCAPISLLSLIVTHDFYRVSLTGFLTSCIPLSGFWPLYIRLFIGRRYATHQRSTSSTRTAAVRRALFLLTSRIPP